MIKFGEMAMYETELERGAAECPFGHHRARAGAPPCPAGAVLIAMPIRAQRSCLSSSVRPLLRCLRR